MNHNKYQAVVLSPKETQKIIDEFKESYTLSFSSLTAYLRCPRLFWYAAIRKLEFVSLKIPFVIGNHINEGIHEIYKKNPNVIKHITKKFREEKSELLKLPGVTPDLAEDLEESELVIRALLKTYGDVYKKHIAKTKHIHTEFRIEYKFDKRVTIKGFIDNVLKQNKKLYIHEVKTTSFLTSDYINRIQISLQIHMYFYFYNLLYDVPMNGIIYDVLRKPGIRQKQKESREEYLERLILYYEDPQKQAESFYMETIEKPLLSKNRIINMINHVVKQIENIKTIDDFFHNDHACWVGNYKCDFYDICHSGENALSLFNFRENRLRDKDEKLKIKSN